MCCGQQRTANGAHGKDESILSRRAGIFGNGCKDFRQNRIQKTFSGKTGLKENFYRKVVSPGLERQKKAVQHIQQLLNFRLIAFIVRIAPILPSEIILLDFVALDHGTADHQKTVVHDSPVPFSIACCRFRAAGIIATAMDWKHNNDDASGHLLRCRFFRKGWGGKYSSQKSPPCPKERPMKDRIASRAWCGSVYSCGGNILTAAPDLPCPELRTTAAGCFRPDGGPASAPRSGHFSVRW